MDVNILTYAEPSIFSFRGPWDAFDHADLSTFSDAKLRQFNQQRFDTIARLLDWFWKTGILIVNPAASRLGFPTPLPRPTLAEIGILEVGKENRTAIQAIERYVGSHPKSLWSSCSFRGSTDLVCGSSGEIQRTERVIVVGYLGYSDKLTIINRSDCWAPVGRHGEKYEFAVENAQRLEECLEGICKLGFEFVSPDEELDGSARKRFRHYNSRVQLLREYPGDAYERVKMFCWEDRNSNADEE